MVLLNEGINRIRDILESDIFKCQAGTGTTSPTSDDTGLQTPDSNTLLAPSNSKTDQAIQITHTINSAIGSGVSYSEQETQINSGSTSLNHIVHTPVEKGSTDEFVYITTLFIKSI